MEATEHSFQTKCVLEVMSCRQDSGISEVEGSTEGYSEEQKIETHLFSDPQHLLKPQVTLVGE